MRKLNIRRNPKKALVEETVKPAKFGKLGSQGTDRLDRVPRGKEVRARVIESLHLRRRVTGIE